MRSSTVRIIWEVWTTHACTIPGADTIVEQFSDETSEIFLHSNDNRPCNVQQYVPT